MSTKKLLVLDNYDSFTYNLVHLAHEIIGHDVDVFRNDEISLDDVGNYEKILLSPGPGIPEEAGILLPVIRRYATTRSIFGVCLGHQAIGESFGGELSNLSSVYHGVSTPITLQSDLKVSSFNNDWFLNLPSTLEVGRYHSWVVKDEGFPSDLEVTSRDDKGMIMSLRHRTFDVQGVQFHPESVLTPDGKRMLENWLKAKARN
ncbi:MAG: anthranilate synthase component II [bacterium]|jgi:anthranilate synthase component 2